MERAKVDRSSRMTPNGSSMVLLPIHCQRLGSGSYQRFIHGVLCSATCLKCTVPQVLEASDSEAIAYLGYRFNRLMKQFAPFRRI